MRRVIGTYEIDDDPARVDPAAAVAFLTTQAYWGHWRGEPDIRRQIAGAWRVTGVYDQDGAMVGFARAGSDGGSAYLADVYVLPAHRGAGLGQAIVAMMVDEGPGAGQRWMLHTADAHGLYRQFGFAAPDGGYLERPAGYRRGPGPAAADARPATGVLAGPHVRLEPLRHDHVPGLVAAAAGGEDLYRWTAVPTDTGQARRYVEKALAARDAGTSVPFAVVRAADGAVIGSTRFWDLVSWPWPERKATPDTCEIGHTWLSRGAIRTGVNTEMKRLMLTHAFEAWGVQSVCLHTDARNQRSRDAIGRIGATFEGILRAHRLAAELGPRDSARFSITAAEWPAVRRHLADLTARYDPALSG
ncbi:MAG TPA: GNAT family N-acetyltransferase [Streptosporangiaceae bacterium]|jgi:RimJ/RimL family protein N-acetyltransferase/GNAT superfamily N-acetyltransferase